MANSLAKTNTQNFSHDIAKSVRGANNLTQDMNKLKIEGRSTTGDHKKNQSIKQHKKSNSYHRNPDGDSSDLLIDAEKK